MLQTQADRSSSMMKVAEKPNGAGEDGGSRQSWVSKVHWKLQEDVKLRQLVALHGPRNWDIISKQIPGRSGKSCRLRWVNQLDPRIKKTVFSRDEDATLMVAHAMFGNQWSHIAKFFPGRTDNAIKNHWHVLTSRGQRNVSFSSSGYLNCHDLPVSGTFMVKPSLNTTCNPFVKLESSTASSRMEGGGATVMEFIDFLGVGE